MKLNEIQQFFSAALMRRERTPIDFLSRGDLEVYRRMYFARLYDALCEDYPAVRAALADDFDALATRYIEQCPSRDPSLRNFGARLAEFLPPPFADLARLERARVEAFDARDATPLTPHDLAGFAPSSRLRLVPSARIVRTERDVEGAWLAADRKEKIPEMRAGARTLLVWRRGFVVRHRAIAGAEARAIASLPCTLAEMCEHADDVVHAKQMLDQWLCDELITS